MKSSEMLWASRPGLQTATDAEDDPGVGLISLPAAWRAPRHHCTSRQPNLPFLHMNREESPVNKAQLVEAVAAQIGGRAKAATAVDAVLDAIVRAVVAGDSRLRHRLRHPRRRTSARPASPETRRPASRVKLPATRVLRFRPGARFKDLVAGRQPLPASGNCIREGPQVPPPVTPYARCAAPAWAGAAHARRNTRCTTLWEPR